MHDLQERRQLTILIARRRYLYHLSSEKTDRGKKDFMAVFQLVLTESLV